MVASSGGDKPDAFFAKNDEVATVAGGVAVYNNMLDGAFAVAKNSKNVVSAVSKGARFLTRSSYMLVGASIGYDFATGTANTSTLVNTGIAIVGGGVVLIVGAAAAPWVALGGAVYGVVSLSGGDDWLNSTWDNSQINFVKP